MGDKVTLLQAGGGLGGTTFATLDNQIPASGATTQPQLTYSANDVVLQWVRGSFLHFALTHNQRAVAFNLDLSAADPRASQLISVLDMMSASRLLSAYDLIAPEELTSIFQLGFSAALRISL
ncbi:MAG: hypothetical protein N2689_01555 [Verrucomicrobiae bacterium]|nr:hypothetical protein [Verrucomicrobiae bacterium]